MENPIEVIADALSYLLNESADRHTDPGAADRPRQLASQIEALRGSFKDEDEEENNEGT